MTLSTPNNHLAWTQDAARKRLRKTLLPTNDYHRPKPHQHKTVVVVPENVHDPTVYNEMLEEFLRENARQEKSGLVLAPSRKLKRPSQSARSAPHVFKPVSHMAAVLSLHVRSPGSLTTKKPVSSRLSTYNGLVDSNLSQGLHTERFSANDAPPESPLRDVSPVDSLFDESPSDADDEATLPGPTRKRTAVSMSDGDGDNFRPAAKRSKKVGTESDTSKPQFPPFDVSKASLPGEGDVSPVPSPDKQIKKKALDPYRGRAKPSEKNRSRLFKEPGVNYDDNEESDDGYVPPRGGFIREAKAEKAWKAKR